MYQSIYRGNMENAVSGMAKAMANQSAQNAAVITAKGSEAVAKEAPKRKVKKWKWMVPAGLAAAGGIYYAGHKNVHRYLADKIGENFGTRQRNSGGGGYNNYDNGDGYY